MIEIRTTALLAPGDAARRLQLSAARILQLVQNGTLPAIKLSDGRNVFRSEDVEHLARQRAQTVR